MYKSAKAQLNYASLNFLNNSTKLYVYIIQKSQIHLHIY